MNWSIHVNTSQRTIKVNGVQVTLSYQRMVCFMFFCINRNQWHSRESIIEKVWPDVHRVPRVVDQVVLAINKAVSKAVPLGKARIIISLPKSGYRLNDDFKVTVTGDHHEILQPESQALDLLGEYLQYNNRKISVTLKGVTSYNQINWVIFTDAAGNYHILPNSDFFATYKKVPQ